MVVLDVGVVKPYKLVDYVGNLKRFVFFAGNSDEYLKFITNNTKNCPYYKYYDEYKSVRRQN